MQTRTLSDKAPQLQSSIELRWPTDYYVVTQGFNANPEIHASQNLPGHEGLDIRAPLNSPVYACATGEIVEAHDRTDDHPYGRYISILHQDGYRTIYGHLTKTVANRGQKVKAGDQIALAGPTGNTGGGHIHLTLKHDGATAAQLTHFTDDTIDPTPFLLPPPAPSPSKFPWPLARCLMGVAAADASGSEADSAAVKQVGVEAAKIGIETPTSQIAKLKQINPALFLMSQLPWFAGGRSASARDWVARLRPFFKQHVEAGISYFEIGQTPNLYSQGCYISWSNGAEFGNWWLDVVNALKTDAPQARFGIPAPAPGSSIFGQRQDSQTFLESADEMMLSADWIGVTGDLSRQAGTSDDFFSTIRRYYPHQLLFLTQLGNFSEPSKAFYKNFEDAPGIGATFS